MTHDGISADVVEQERPPSILMSPTSGTSAVAALASMGAGAIHATAVGVHGEHRQAAIVFVLVATFQLGWGVAALVGSQAWLGLLGAAGNATVLGGWAMAKTSGISFVDGLEEAESLQFADALGAAFAGVAILAVLVGFVGRLGWARRRPRPTFVTAAIVATVLLAVPAMVDAGGHDHSGGHGHETAAGHDGNDRHGSVVVAPEPYDGTLPVDLGGAPGITAEEQEEAEALATRTIERLPQFANPQAAYDRGYRSIGDAHIGVEHYVNWELINDDTFLHPDRPESLVYEVDGQERTLVAAMYMLTNDHTLETTPDIGGDLIQWHIHDDLCFAGEENAWRLAGYAAPPEECPPGSSRGPQAPMIHVWITAHPCGAFASLEGIAGGQIPEGEERACDHVHGDRLADVE